MTNDSIGMDEASIIEELNRVRRETVGKEDQAAPKTGALAVSPMGVRLLAAAKDGLDWVLDFMLIGEIPFIGQIPGALFRFL